jgi:hypothetical protein
MTTLAQLRDIRYPPTWAAPRTEAERLTQESVMLMHRYWLLLVAVAEATERLLDCATSSDFLNIGVSRDEADDALAALRARLDNQ